MPSLNPTPRPTQKAPLILALLFCVVLALPSLYQVLSGRAIYPFIENRAQTEWPERPVSVQEAITIPMQISAYYNDRFGLRDVLLRVRHTALVYGLGVSPVNEVVLGREGWLYSTDPTLPSDQFLGVIPMTDAQLDVLEEKLTTTYAPFKEKNIPFYLVVSPDKETVHPEYLPGTVNVMDTQTRLRHFYANVQVEAGIHLVNPLPAIMDAKARQTVYYATDTHWNDYGAFAAAPEIIRAMQADFPGFSPRPLSYYEVKSAPVQGMDLASMLGLPEMPDQEYNLLTAAWTPQELPDGASVLVTGHDGPVLLFVRDSFGKALLGYLADYFSKIIIVPVDVDYLPYLQSEPIDVALFETVERAYLYYP